MQCGESSHRQTATRKLWNVNEFCLEDYATHCTHTHTPEHLEKPYSVRDVSYGSVQVNGTIQKVPAPVRLHAWIGKQGKLYLFTYRTSTCS